MACQLGRLAISFSWRSLAGAVFWLALSIVLADCSPLSLSACLPAFAFLIYLALGAAGAAGITVAQGLMLMDAAPGTAPFTTLLLALAPGLGAYAGFAAAQRCLGLDGHLRGLKRWHLPVLALSAAATSWLCDLAASDHGPLILSSLRAALLQFILIMILLTMLQLLLAGVRQMRRPH
jgi:hypothetical protein